MKLAALYPGTYLKASDIKGHVVRVVIDRVEVEDLGGETKPVLYFTGKDKGMVLNKTNATTIAEVYGDEDTETWEGKLVELYVARVDFQGKRVDGLRVRIPEGAPMKARAVQPDPDSEHPGDGSDVPF